MFGVNQQHSRLCVIEATFKEFQETMSKHMRETESNSSEVRAALKDIIKHIDDAQKQGWRATEDMRRDILSTVDKEYYTKATLEEKLSETRASINSSLAAENKKLVDGLKLSILLVTMTLGFCGWVYINVVVPTSSYRPLTATEQRPSGAKSKGYEL